MELKKTALIAIIVLAAPLTAAATTSFTYTDGSKTLQPNQNQTVGNLTVEFDGNETYSEVLNRNFDNFPFQVRSVNETFYNGGEAFNATISASVPKDFPPTDSTQTDSFLLEFGNIVNTTEVKSEIDYNVPLVNDVQFGKENVSKDLNVGDRGNVYTNITLTQIGNADQVPVDYNVTGNITELLDNPQGSFTLYRTNPERIYLQTDIPLNQPYGNYSGTLKVDAGSDNATVNLEATVSDIVAPEIESKSIEDVEATRSRTLEFEISDNIGVKNATADIFYDRGENQSRQSLTSFNLTQRENNEDLWFADFKDTDERGNYTAEITAYDTSGNKVTGSSNFRIIRLDAVDLETTNFEFEASPTGESVQQHIATVEIDTPVDFVLSDFSHDQENSTIYVGIKSEEMETPDDFDLEQENATVRFEEEGEYSLVVGSDSRESFRGDLHVKPINQSKELPKIDFEGIFIDPKYPQPDSFSIGQFEGSISYDNEEDTVKETIIFEGRVDAERCRGVEFFTNCLTGYTMGEAERLEGKVDDLQSQVSTWQFIAALSWILVVGYVIVHRRSESLENAFHMYKEVTYNE